MITLRNLYPPRPRPRGPDGRFRALTKEERDAYYGERLNAVVDQLTEASAVLADIPWVEAPGGVPPFSWRR